MSCRRISRAAVRNKAVRDSGVLARGYRRFVKYDFRSEASEAKQL